MDSVLVSPSPFRANVIDAPSAQLFAGSALESFSSGAQLERVTETGQRLAQDADAVRVKINTLQVMQGLEPGFLGLAPAKGVYLVTSVVDGMSDQPVSFNGQVHERVKNGDVLPIGTEGGRDQPLNVYLKEGGLPPILGISVVVFRSNENLRQFGGLITEVTADKRYEKLTDIIATAATAVVPAYGIIWQAANEIIGLVGSLLKATPDEQLGYYEARFTRRFDDLGVGHHPPEGVGHTVAAGRVRLAYQVDVA
jgi:hypothetical protein